MNETRERPSHSVPSKTEKIPTGLGKLYPAVTFDEDKRPSEVFGWIGKTGSFGHGMTRVVPPAAFASSQTWYSD